MGQTTDPATGGLTGPGRDPRVRLAFLTVAIAAAAAAAGGALDPARIQDGSHVGVIVALAAGFALSERFVFHLEARNEAVSYAPTEIALAVGLLFVSPVPLVLARLAGATFGMLAWRRPPTFKLVFNLAHFALETVLAYAVVAALGPGGVLTTWLALLTALTVALISGGILVAVAISLFEGDLRARVGQELLNAPVLHLPTAVLAASVAVPMTVDPWLGLVAVAPAPVLWVLVRSHGSLLHRFADLTRVHDFSREVGDHTDLREIAATAAERIAQNSRAGRLLLRLWAGDGTPVDAVVGPPVADGSLPRFAEDPDWIEVLGRRRGTRLDPAGRQPFRAPLAGAGIVSGLVAPVADESGALGVIVLADRQGSTSRFDEDDLARLEAMTQQLAVAVRKARLHAQIRYEANHDSLTGLANRSYLEAWMDQAIPTMAAGALLLIDLDRFKEINDAFGHGAGDRLIIEAAARIRSACTDGDLAARFGGDEFAVFAPDLEPADAGRLAVAISDALEEPFVIGPATVAIAASIGVALAPEHGRDTVELLRRADIAMYDAKRRRLRATTYRDDMEENDATRLTLLADLRLALDHGALGVHFQPQLDLQTGEVTGAEALARWHHPERGDVSPDVFVNLAEQAGLIEQLTRHVLGQATAAAAQWQRRGWRMAVSVNISAQSLLDEQLEPLVAETLSASGLAPELLTLEITETTMMGDPDRTHRILQRLAGLGIRLSVDDYGTGYSSLSHLRHLPVAELKIDRSFVSEMMSEQSDDVIIHSTIELAHNLGLVVVAEGVESEAAQQRLTNLGCDVGQGFGICRPVPHHQFLVWVDRHRAPDPLPSETAVSSDRPEPAGGGSGPLR